MPHGGGKRLEAGLARVPVDPPLDRRGDARRRRRGPDRRPDRGLPARAEPDPGADAATRRHGRLHRRVDRGRDPLGAVRVERPRRSPAVETGGMVDGGRACRPGGGDGPLSGAGRRLPGHRPARPGGGHLRRVPGEERHRRTGAAAVAAAEPGAVGPLHRRRVHPPGHRSTSPARLPTAEEVHAVRRGPEPREAGPADRRPAGAARVRHLLRDEVGRHPPQQAGEQRSNTSGRPTGSTTGSAGRSPRTARTTSSPGGVLAASGTPETAPAVVWYRGPQPAGRSSSTTRRRSSSGCGSSAPSATTTRSRSGARTTTTASPPSSPGSAARTRRRPRRWPAATSR